MVNFVAMSYHYLKAEAERDDINAEVKDYIKTVEPVLKIETKICKNIII